ncbi:MAG: hypothetical protein SGILL_004654, partial [Bacillariaceae sp.]
AERLAMTTPKKSAKKVVQRTYDEAISMLERSGLTHYAAMANESTGLYLLNVYNDRDWAEHYLKRALGLYSEWGAVVKVEQMLKQHGFLERSSVEKPLGNKSLGGKSKFDSSRDMAQPLTRDSGTAPRYSKDDLLL